MDRATRGRVRRPHGADAAQPRRRQTMTYTNVLKPARPASVPGPTSSPAPRHDGRSARLSGRRSQH